jgi:hypothetical protein
VQNLKICSTTALSDALVLHAVVSALASSVSLLIKGDLTPAGEACLFASQQLPLIHGDRPGRAACKLVELVSRVGVWAMTRKVRE